MLYHLALEFIKDYSWLNVFRYQSFRTLLAFMLSFVLVVAALPLFISKLKQYGLKGQPIREDGPKDHASKRGTPTMGGAVIIIGVLMVALLLCDLRNIFVWLSLGVMLGFAALGFFDDWRKITQQTSAGLSERQKIVWQIVVSVVAAAALVFSGFATELNFPFFKSWTFDLWFFFIPFAALVIVGTSNAVNLTDGLDGLAIFPVMTVAGTYAIIAYVVGNKIFADYLFVSYVPGTGELAIVLAAIAGGGLAFLWYNTFPAQIFMGDVGALALGGVLGFIAVVVKHEVVLVFAGGIFVVEALSVIIQRYSYKLRKKRVFKMAPIHHHFELKGWAEPKIIVRFWIISILLALFSIATLKLR